MKTGILMRVSALTIGVIGLALSFLPEEILSHYGAQSGWGGEFVLQATGAAYVGFAVMNWMARDILIGGIYSRPLAMGNFVHFVVVMITLLKVLLDGRVRSDVVIAFAVFAVFAIWFGFVAFTHPIQPKPNRTSAARSERADPVG
jgi:hypothetical protein